MTQDFGSEIVKSINEFHNERDALRRKPAYQLRRRQHRRGVPVVRPRAPAQDKDRWSRPRPPWSPQKSAMRARARLNRLEQGRSSCAKCGQPSDHNYDVTHVDSFETYQEAVSEPAFCEACGSKVLFPVYLNLDGV
jgi:DNA-directed RNA polymerase subunit RPC12/RpoP